VRIHLFGDLDKFQFPKDQLKVLPPPSLTLVHFVSIPEGPIKRAMMRNKSPLATLFQFPKDQLKVLALALVALALLGFNSRRTN